MSDYTEPTNAMFEAAEQTALDIMTTKYPGIQTKSGSVVRELLVRPFAYLYSWCRANLATYRRQATVAYLKTSQATVNPVADAIASNYFVERRLGTKSKGVITMTTTLPVLQLPAGSTFSAGGVQLTTPSRTIAMGGVETGLRDDTMYVPITAVGNNYVANIPVEAVNAGAVELNAGTPVTMEFTYTGIVSAELTSPVTGGQDTETDAQLMRRAEYNTASSGVGSWYGLRKLLNNAPVNVMDFGLLAGEDEMLYRARYNNVSINPGGFADCHVKTQRQISIGELTGTLTASSGSSSVTFGSTTAIAGALQVVQVIVNGTVQTTYSVSFGSSSATVSADGARLGSPQTLTVTIPSTFQNNNVTVYVMYMPGIPALQEYVDSDANKFIGQDIMVKAAVPVAVHLDCTVASPAALTDDRITLLKSTLSDAVDAMPVGAGILNFSDLRKAVSAALPDVDLRLPCTMSAEMPMKSGGVYAYHSETGLLDITSPVNTDTWDSAVCFFSLIPDNIRIDEL